MLRIVRALVKEQIIEHVYLYLGRGFLTVEDFKKAVGHVAPHLPMHAVDLSFR